MYACTRVIFELFGDNANEGIQRDFTNMQRDNNPRACADSQYRSSGRLFLRTTRKKYLYVACVFVHFFFEGVIRIICYDVRIFVYVWKLYLLVFS